MSDTKDLDDQERRIAEGIAACLKELMRPEWIPVSERLPKDRVIVLTCGDDPVDGPFMLLGCREPASRFGPPDWHLPGFSGFGPVSHWMPLPEPPANYPELS